MVNFHLIYKIIGSLLLLLGSLLALCTGISFYYMEDDIMAFLLSTLITYSCGFILKFMGRNANNNLSRRDAYLLVTLTWIVFSLFGMIPFLIGGYIESVTDAFFETMSGFSTTGATVIDDVEWMPHAILFWRTQTQWIGALGIVFFTIAILPSMVGSGSVKVFAAEATGPIRSKMHPRLSTTAKWIWSVYSALTIACILAFYLAGMGVFDSINYAMTTTATGGFAPHNDSAAFFQSPAIEYIAILFQFLAGVNFTMLYFAIFRLKIANLFKSSEFKLYILAITVSTIWIMYLLMSHNGYGLERAFRCALFQVVSFMTTTGLFNDDAGLWPHITWVILGTLMFLGACAGSTTGGFKCIRGVMIIKVLRNEFNKLLHPNAVLPVKINGQPVSQQKLNSLLAFFAIFSLMILFSATIMIVAGIDNTNAITIALSCISNVGPTLGTQIGPEMSWSQLPDYIKWICSFLMLAGRLEIMSVLVLFTRGFWKDN
ncbi:MAG: TrkH family potassium uptake protein [Prevotella sp.]|nr:TrkH family potassium uptake protein [Prevotella sp.]